MSIKTVVEAGRRAAEARMTDTCIVTRRVYNRAEKKSEDIIVYEGKFRVRTTNTNAAMMPDAGGKTAMQQNIAHFPWSTVLIKGDQIKVTSGDPQLARTVFTVRGASPGSQNSAARYQVESVM